MIRRFVLKYLRMGLDSARQAPVGDMKPNIGLEAAVLPRLFTRKPNAHYDIEESRSLGCPSRR